MESSAGTVQTETVAGNVLAVIYHGGVLGETLQRLLLKEHLRVLRLTSPTAALAVWERPNYIFFFVSEKEPLPALQEQFAETRKLVEETRGRMVLVFDNSEEFEKDFLGKEAAKDGVIVVKVRGRSGVNADWVYETAARIRKLAFSTRDEGAEPAGVLIIGKGSDVVGGKARRLPGARARSVEEIMANLGRGKRWPVEKGTWMKLGLWVLIVILLAPFVWLGTTTVVGFSSVVGAAEALRQDNIGQAQESAAAATSYFAQAKRALTTVAVIWPIFGGKDFSDRYGNMLSVGEKAADVVERAVVLVPKVQALTRGVLNGAGSGDISGQVAELSAELEPMDEDLGLLEGQLGPVLTPKLTNLLSFFGIPAVRTSNYRSEITTVREEIGQAQEVLSVAGEIIPPKGLSRTYLVVFQNNAELRPTGGFIGSYALVHFDAGKMSGFKIYDIYNADGQLRGSVAPPDEILHFLGQPQWFMRDANWAADWPLTARRLEWFLEKETGVTVDGVIGVDLGAIQAMLRATGPLIMPDQQTTVTADNFFEKAEYASEINFFPGSDQKPQFLAQVAQTVFDKLTAADNVDWLALGQTIHQAVVQKDMLFYFDSVLAQKVMAGNDWAGSITALTCGQENNNCLMAVEANFGANKANYFVKRSVRVDTVIDKGGGLETTVMVNYQNDSPNASWPGGDYKNYLRFLVPLGSTFESLDLGDKRTASLSSTLTADVIAAVPPDQFLVFRSGEQALNGKITVASAAASFGVLVEVPVGAEKMVTFKYRPPYRLNFENPEQNFQFVFLRQPGTGADTLDFGLDYPSFLTPVWSGQQIDRDLSVLALPQKLVYNTDLSQDRVINVKFKRQ